MPSEGDIRGPWKPVVESDYGTTVYLRHLALVGRDMKREICVKGQGAALSIDQAIQLQDALWRYIQEAQAAEEAT